MPPSSSADLPDLGTTTAVITGATGGVGLATARALAGAGARVVLAVRDVARGEGVAARLGGRVEVRELDLADLRSVRAFAAAWDDPIDLLVNNAGVSARSLQRTADGFEADFGVNHLGHFALTGLLLDRVTGRVVTVASQAERAARLDLDDPNWERRRYRPARAYNDSKLANLLFTAELQRRLTAAGSAVRALAAHPGLVVTGMYRPEGRWRPADVVMAAAVRLFGQQPEQGALPTLYAAVADLPGDSFAGPAHLAHMRGEPELIGRSATARDADLAARLWDLSERLTGVTARL
jgi:NAD(P)-dependent dehydrogenase (short-subunit alcohol dehydrogenase family)